MRSSTRLASRVQVKLNGSRSRQKSNLDSSVVKSKLLTLDRVRGALKSNSNVILPLPRRKKEKRKKERASTKLRRSESALLDGKEIKSTSDGREWERESESVR